MRTTGNRFHIQDYQIVNGCQTSHVLNDQRDRLDPSVMVPVRLIGTADEEVIGAIVKATNRQTEGEGGAALRAVRFSEEAGGVFYHIR